MASPSTHAVEADDTACFEPLLAGGATVRDTNALGNAIRDPAKVRVLLEQGDLRPSDPELHDALLYPRASAVVALVQAIGWNINRDGVVFMQAVEGRDIDALVQRTAEVSAAVLEIEE